MSEGDNTGRDPKGSGSSLSGEANKLSSSLRDYEPSRNPPLSLVAEHIPHGFECRSCGGSGYNWVKKCARYVETGEGCCPDFRLWIEKAKAGEPTVEERHKARLRKDPPFIGLPLGNGDRAL